MEFKVLGGLLFLGLVLSTSATLSPSGVNYEVVALMAIKHGLNDPHNALANWDINSVDPCSWGLITCSEGSVSTLALISQGLSGTLSPSIGNLSNLQSVLLQNNAMSGPIPADIGKLDKLQTLDLSNNKFSGGIPSSVGDLKNLNYLRLNNNSFSGPCPESLSNIHSLTLVDLSYNNLSGSLPKISARTFKFVGNPAICGPYSRSNCSALSPELIPFTPYAPDQSHSGTRNHHFAIILGLTIGSVSLVIFVLGLILWWRYRHNKQIFFDVNEQYDTTIFLGHLKKYSFKDLRAATDHFNAKNILGKGGFGIVYKGCLQDGTVVAVKRLTDYNNVGGEVQFQTEVQMISLAVHKNILRLHGYCSTENERILVYPYMSNGSVASRLTEIVNGKPALDWPMRKRIALGAARGLLYLHEQCDPKIIHRDVKAANILLDEDFEAVVGDFGLAKLLDHQDTHVTTAVRGTVGHIAPEYLSTGQSSQKTDVFGYGILLLELITGEKALDFGRATNQKGVMLDWVKKLHEEGKLSLMVARGLKNSFDRSELEEMVKVALLCTQFDPSQRPKMSEIVRMLESEGLTEKWEASQSNKIDTPRTQSSDKLLQRYSDYIEDSSLILEPMELSGPR